MKGLFLVIETTVLAMVLSIALLNPATQALSQAKVLAPASENVGSEDLVPSMRFDVVSIKPDTSEIAPSVNVQRYSDFVSLKNMSLSSIIEFAYKFHRPDLVLGLPSWAKTERYDLTAKVSLSDAPEYQKMTNTQHRLMLQTLLADSFKLKVHKDLREMQVYELVISKNGSKLTINDGHTGPNITVAKPGHLKADGILMTNLADTLTQINIGRPVVDHTGLSGRYDFELLWAPNDDSSVMDMGMSEERPASPENPGQSIFSALRDQLGLELRPAKAPAECLVIDSADRPAFD